MVVSFLKDFLNAWYVQSVILCSHSMPSLLTTSAQEETHLKIISMVEELTGEDTEGGEAVLTVKGTSFGRGVKINSADEQKSPALSSFCFPCQLLPIILNEPENIIHHEIANIPGFDREQLK